MPLVAIFVVILISVVSCNEKENKRVPNKWEVGYTLCSGDYKGKVSSVGRNRGGFSTYTFILQNGAKLIIAEKDLFQCK